MISHSIVYQTGDHIAYWQKKQEKMRKGRANKSHIKDQMAELEIKTMLSEHPKWLFERIINTGHPFPIPIRKKGQDGSNHQYQEWEKQHYCKFIKIKYIT